MDKINDLATEETTPLDSSLARRIELRDRHAAKLTRLMDERSDLRGVHRLADFVDDAVRWTA
ncbi:hypothetical protein GCM10022237_23190 [Nocardioides ginsengisoli]|uniref:Uncharacterized protein n=1 Tax=Nocardioides ginsengisoli TaxID=363868 RepID=A0ABW3W775_9ACTN